MRKISLLSTVAAMSAAMGILTGTGGPCRRTGDKTISQRHDPKRVRAADVKRDRRCYRNIRVAMAGGYGKDWVAN